MLPQLAQHIYDGLIVGAILSLPAIGIAMVWRIAGFPHVAHGNLLTAPAYAAWLAVDAGGWPWLAAVAVGVVVAVALGLLMHVGVYRPLNGRPMFSIFLASVGLTLIIRFGSAALFGNQFRNFPLAAQRGLPVGPLVVNSLDLVIMAAALLALAGTWALLKRTLIGKRMRAAADNPSLARISGIRPDTTLVHMWTLVSVLAGIGGILIGTRNALYPDMGWDLLLPTFAAALLGGLTNPFGAVVGALLMGVAQNVGVLWIPTSYGAGIAFAVIALVLALRPTGIFGESSRA